MGEMRNILEDYQPQKEQSGFEIIKANNLKCVVNSARIEEYPPNSQRAGQERFRYELEVIDEASYSGRRFWKSFPLSDENRVKRLADFMFTIGKPVKSKEDLESIIVELTGMFFKVRAWGWTPDDADEPRQMHAVKGVYEDSETAPYDDGTNTAGSTEAKF